MASHAVDSLTDEVAVELVRNASRRAAQAAVSVGEAAEAVVRAARLIASAMTRGGKILVCGNGGSAACAQHFAAEFTGKLSLDRRPLAAISLTVDTSAMTAIGNDFGYAHIFERQVRALATSLDVVVGLSTSGTSANVKEAIEAARAIGARTISLTGPKDELGADQSLKVPVFETARIQEAHDLMLHELAQLIERFLIDMPDDASADRFPFVLDDARLTSYRAWLSETKQTMATTNGAFDLLHAGHRASLSAAGVLGDRLVVLVNSDESVARLKGSNRPIRPLQDRIEDLRAHGRVDHVVVMHDDEPSRLLELLRPDVHAKGSEYASTGIVEEPVVVAGGGRVAYLDRIDGYSTSALESKARAER